MELFQPTNSKPSNTFKRSRTDVAGRAANVVWHPVFVFLVIAGIFIARSWQAIRYPILAVEDGTLLLSKYFNTTDFRSVFDSYAGYLSLVSNLMAWISTRGPVTAVPYLFIGSALLFAIVGIFLLTREPYAWLVADARDRAMLAVVLSCVPFGRGLLISNLCYSQWSLLFLLVVLLARRLPAGGLALTGYLTVVFLAIFSHPLSLIVLPICLVHVRMEKRLIQRWLAAGIGAAAVLYQLFCVEHSAPLRLSLKAGALTVKLFHARVVFESFAGTHATILLLNHSPRYVYLCGATALGLAGIGFLHHQVPPWWKRLVAVGVCMAVGTLLMSVVARLIALPETEVLNPHLQRYFYLSKLIMVVLSLSLWLPPLRRAVVAWRWPARSMLICAVGSYFLAINSDNAFLYASNRDEASQLAQFLGKVNLNVSKARNGQPYISEWILPREDPWSIKLSVDAHLQRGIRTP